jgi:peptidoglycan/xylan/chitin deacetylase (PgdA/CDA1 family)
MNNKKPIVSFTFDDFPRSSYLLGGKILNQYDFKATYFTSFGLMGQQLPVGEGFIEKDILNLLDDGHELGSHTFDHFESWKTSSNEFKKSIEKNMAILAEISPGTFFKSFSYPKTNPNPNNKSIAGRYFDSCRAGGQTYNLKKVDLNLLRSYFIDKRNNRQISELKNLIDINIFEKGWLIISTHDISNSPSKFGCNIEYFMEIVEYVAKRNIDVITIAEVVKRYCK